MAFTGNIIARIGADIRGLQQGLKQAQSNLSGFRNTSNQTLSSLSKEQQRLINQMNGNMQKLNASFKIKNPKMMEGFSKSASGSLEEVALSTLALRGATVAVSSTLAAFAGVGYATYALINNQATKMAMEVEASTQQLSRIYGNNAKDIMNWAKTQSIAYNMSRAEAIKYSAVYGNLISSITDDSAKNAKYTEDLLKASAVVASATGRDMTDVMERIRSGLLGNTEAIEDLGINVNVAMLESTEVFKRFANGKSWDQLSFRTQQQIRLFAIMEQANKKFGTSVSSNTSSSLAQFTAYLKDAMLNLGNAFLPIVQRILPYLTEMARGLALLTEDIARFSRNVFGYKEVQEQSNSVTNKANKAQDNLGDSIKETAKEAKRGVASFDEINQLQEDMANSANVVADSMRNIPYSKPIDSASEFDKVKNKDNKIIIPIQFQMPDPPTFPPMPAPDTSALEGALATIETRIKEFKKKFPVNADVNIIATDNIPQVTNQILIKMAEFTEKFPVYVSIFANDYVTPMINSMTQNLQSFAAWISENWKPIVTGAMVAVGAIAAFVFGGKIIAAIGAAGAAIGTFVSGLTASVPSVVASTGAISTGFTAAVAVISGALLLSGTEITLFVSKIQQNFAAMKISISEWVTNTSKNLSTWTQNAKQYLLDFINMSSQKLESWKSSTSNGIADWVNNVLQNINTFARDGEKFISTWANNSYNVMSNWLSGTSSGVYNWAKDTIGTIIDWAKSAWGVLNKLAGIVGKSIGDGINWTATAISNTFKGIGNWADKNKDWLIPLGVAATVVGVTVATGGTNLVAAGTAAGIAAIVSATQNQSDNTKIPKFATGGIVTSPTLAMIGEAGTEAVVPLENTGFIDAMASKIGSAVIAAMQFNSGNQTQSGDIILQVDGSKFAQVMNPYLAKENQRIGNKLIIQGV